MPSDRPPPGRLDEALRRLRDSVDYEEDSVVTVVMQAPPAPASSVRAPKSLPPPFSWVVGTARAFVVLVPPAQRLWPVLLLLGAAIGYGAHRLGLW